MTSTTTATEPFTEDEKDFYVQIDNGVDRYFCHICRFYGTIISSKKAKDGGDFILKGRILEGKPSYKKSCLRVHKESKQHKNALAQEAAGEFNRTWYGKPTANEQKLATENLCRVVQHVIDEGVGYPGLGKIVALLDEISFKDKINPIGNLNHSYQTFGHLVKANKFAVKDTLKQELLRVNPVTKQEKKFSIALDKGIASGDATRQYIVATHIDENGNIKETIVSAARILDKSSQGCLEHLIESCTDLIDMKNIIMICTDTKAVYCRETEGMHGLLRNDDHFDPRIVGLLDVCHKFELSLKKVMPEWLQELLEVTGNIAKCFEPRSILSQLFYDYSFNDPVLEFRAIKGMVEARYMQHVHNHLDSILINISMFIKYLPKVLHENDMSDHHEKAQYVFDYIKDPKFIFRLLLANTIFIEAANISATAQRKDFNAFLMSSVLKRFKYILQIYMQQKLPWPILDFLETGKLRYGYQAKKQIHAVDVDYSIVEDFKSSILDEEFVPWIRFLQGTVARDVMVPICIEDIVEFFEEETDLKRKEQILIWCFKHININFHLCGANCEGFQHCSCLFKEIERFSNHFNKERKTRKYEEIHESLRKYLDKDKQCDELNVVNVLRLIEVALLMKATQSSTEKINTYIADIIEGHCAMRHTSFDMVEAIVFIKYNSNFVLLDAELARVEFLRNKHREALCSTLPKETRSKVSKRIREEYVQGNNLQKASKRRKLKLKLTDSKIKNMLGKYRRVSRIAKNKSQEERKNEMVAVHSDEIANMDGEIIHNDYVINFQEDSEAISYDEDINLQKANEAVSDEYNNKQDNEAISDEDINVQDKMAISENGIVEKDHPKSGDKHAVLSVITDVCRATGQDQQKIGKSKRGTKLKGKIGSRDRAKCPVCMREIRQLYNLTAHLKKVHKEFVNEFLPMKDEDEASKFICNKVRNREDLKRWIEPYKRITRINKENVQDSNIQAKGKEQDIIDVSNSNIQAKGKEQDIIDVSDSNLQAKRNEQDIIDVSECNIQAKGKEQQLIDVSDSNIQAKGKEQVIIDVSDSNIQAKGKDQNINDVRNSLKEEFKIMNPATKQEKKLIITLNKGRAREGESKLIIVATCSDANGNSEEILLSDSKIFDKTSQGCLVHLTKECIDLINMRNIVCICTDSMGEYLGSAAEMSKLLSINSNYDSRVVVIPDVCQLLEFILKNDMPEWLIDMLEKSSKIASYFEPGSVLSESIVEYCSININYKFTENGHDYCYNSKKFRFTDVSKIEETNFIGSTHKHIESLLQNISIFQTFLPEILGLEHLSQYHEKAHYVFAILNDPIFIARLLISNEVFLHACSVVEAAQRFNFSLFDLKDIVKFKRHLEYLKQGRLKDNIYNFFKNGKLTYYSKHNNNDLVFKADNIVDETLKRIFFKEYMDWVIQLDGMVTKNIEIPCYVDKIINFFLVQTDMKTKWKYFIWCIENININFYKCSDFCHNFSKCPCLLEEINRFHEHFLKRARNMKNCNYPDVLRRYLIIDVEIEKLNIVNILRLIEFTFLIKSSQSTISRIMDEYFPMSHDDLEGPGDMLEDTAFTKLNSSMGSIDAKDARKEYVKMNDFDNMQDRNLLNVLHESAQGRNVLNYSRKRKRVSILNLDNSSSNKRRSHISKKRKESNMDQESTVTYTAILPDEEEVTFVEQVTAPGLWSQQAPLVFKWEDGVEGTQAVKVGSVNNQANLAVIDNADSVNIKQEVEVHDEEIKADIEVDHEEIVRTFDHEEIKVENEVHHEEIVRTFDREEIVATTQTLSGKKSGNPEKSQNIVDERYSILCEKSGLIVTTGWSLSERKTGNSDSQRIY